MREKSEGRQLNASILENGSFWELVVKMALPAVVIIIIMIIYNLADTFFIGQTGDPNKISAISICMPVFTILSGLGTLFGIGGGTSISISLGEKDTSKIRAVTAFCGVGTLVVGILYMLGVIIFARPLCILLGADENTMDFALTYLRVFALASPLILFSNSFGNILRSDGDATAPMIANMSGTLANIGLDALFILLFHWDVFGAAFASVLGNLISVILVFWILKKRKPIFFPHLRELKLKKDIVIPVLTLGLPMTFTTMLGSVTNTIQNRLMMKHGSVFLAAQSVAGKMNLLITMVILGFCMGLQPAISYSYGAKNEKRMNKVLRQILVFCLILGILLTAVIFTFRNQMIAAFIDNDEVIQYGQIFVLAAVIVGPIYGIYQVCTTFLQATGKVTFAIFVSLLDKGLIYIPVLFVMDGLFGAYGIAFAHAVTMVFSVVIAVILALIWKKQISREFAQAREEQPDNETA